MPSIFGVPEIEAVQTGLKTVIYEYVLCTWYIIPSILSLMI